MTAPGTLLVCDLDGTLTFTRARPEPAVITSLFEIAAAAAPVRLALATSRSPRCLSAWFPELLHRIERICCNGALCLTSTGLSRRPLPRAALTKVVNRLAADGVDYCLEYGTHFAASDAAGLPWMGVPHRFVLPPSGPAPGHLRGVLKCSVADAEAACAATADIAGITVLAHATGDADLVAAGVDKWDAVDALRRPGERVVAFGNDGNDLRLLQAADRAFVVGTGLPALDALAHVVRLEASSGAVAAALQDYALAS